LLVDRRAGLRAFTVRVSGRILPASQLFRLNDLFTPFGFAHRSTGQTESSNPVADSYHFGERDVNDVNCFPLY
jgi:hypothetical protein